LTASSNVVGCSIGSRRAGIEPVPRERVFGLLEEWSKVL